MALARSASCLRRWAFGGIAVLGLCLAVDVVLAYAFVLVAVVFGGALNPYLGIVFVFVLPLIFAFSAVMIGWSWQRLSPAEVTSEVAVQGR